MYSPNIFYVLDPFLTVPLKAHIESLFGTLTHNHECITENTYVSNINIGTSVFCCGCTYLLENASF